MKYVLITGGSSGIGFSLAKKFASDGYGLILVSSNQEKLTRAKEQLQSSYNVSVLNFAMNLAQRGAAESLYEAVRNAGIEVSVLINNAGIGVLGATEQIPIKRDEELLELNMITPVTLTKLFLADMYRVGEGRILNVCSTGAFQPGPYTATYYASKSFLLSYTKAVRYEAKEKGVIICALCPGTTDTGFFERADGVTPKGAMSSDKVADYAYKQFMRGKEVIIPGLSYRLMKLFPERLKMIAVALVKKPRK